MPAAIEVHDMRGSSGQPVAAERSVPRMGRTYRSLLFELFGIGGLMIFLLGNNWNSHFPANDSTLYKWSLPVLCLAMAV